MHPCIGDRFSKLPGSIAHDVLILSYHPIYPPIYLCNAIIPLQICRASHRTFHFDPHEVLARLGYHCFAYCISR